MENNSHPAIGDSHNLYSSKLATGYKYKSWKRQQTTGGNGKGSDGDDKGNRKGNDGDSDSKGEGKGKDINGKGNGNGKERARTTMVRAMAASAMVMMDGKGKGNGNGGNGEQWISVNNGSSTHKSTTPNARQQQQCHGTVAFASPATVATWRVCDWI